jgi:multiple sugar transport system permease protein
VSFFDNVVDLSTYQGGIFWRWTANTALYAGVGGLASAFLSGITGYAFAKFRFPGRSFMFNVLLAGVLVPAIILAIPQYLLLAKMGLTNTYWAVLLPSIVSPYGMYLARIYAAAAIPDSLIEAARTDGASEWRIFLSVALPVMRPGLVTVFLFQFVAIWNNFLLPFIMLGDDRKFPLTVGLYTLLNRGNTLPALYTLVITGSLLSIIPLVALFLTLQRYWRIDLVSGAVRA